MVNRHHRLNVQSGTLFIGDNLPVLQGINSNSVDLVYLDPPHNSGRTYRATATGTAAGFEYNDTWTAEDMDIYWLNDIQRRQENVFSLIATTRLIHDQGLAAYLTFMGVRLMELQRILKPSGSIYLHCSPHTSHYLKALMDSIFGHEQFRNEIIWKRGAVPAGPKRWRWTHDTILFYAGRTKYRWNQVPQEPSPEYLRRYYQLSDERGNYQAQPLTAAGTRDDERGDVWRGFDPGAHGQHWDVSISGLRQAYPERDDLNDLGVIAKLELLEEAGLVHWPQSGGLPRYKIYVDMSRGERLSDLVTTIGPIERRSAQYTGWPEQVPEDLLDIIIRASSNRRDIVLDPFCGSGTACVVAERLRRQWIGIEQAREVRRVLRRRFRRLPDHPRPIIARDIPNRTDINYG